MNDDDIETNEWYWHTTLGKPVFVFGLDAESLKGTWQWNATEGGDTRSYFTVEAQDLEEWQ